MRVSSHVFIILERAFYTCRRRRRSASTMFLQKQTPTLQRYSSVSLCPALWLLTHTSQISICCWTDSLDNRACSQQTLWPLKAGTAQVCKVTQKVTLRLCAPGFQTFNGWYLQPQKAGNKTWTHDNSGEQERQKTKTGSAKYNRHTRTKPTK